MAAAVAVQKAQAVPEAPTSEPMEVSGEQQNEEDLYTRLKTLQRQLEFLEIQVSYGGGETKTVQQTWRGLAIADAWGAVGHRRKAGQARRDRSGRSAMRTAPAAWS